MATRRQQPLRAPGGRRRLGAGDRGERTVTPLYHQMYLVLRQRLRDREFAEGEPLPGENQLARQFGVSRVTVRRTLRQLEIDGLVVRRQGAGTFPAALPAEFQDRYNIGGLTNAPVPRGVGAVVTTLKAGTTAAPFHVAELLGTGAEPVLRIDSQRALGRGEPFTLLTTWVHPRYAGLLGARERRSAPTLAALEHAGVAMTRAEQTVTARAADEHAARLLRVPVGAPLIAMTTRFMDGDNAPVAFLEALYRPDRYEYRFAMRRARGRPGEPWQMEE